MAILCPKSTNNLWTEDYIKHLRRGTERKADLGEVANLSRERRKAQPTKLTTNGYRSDKKEYCQPIKGQCKKILIIKEVERLIPCWSANQFVSSSDHMSFNGPAKIIQCYTCKSFIEMTSAARLSALKEKGFCFQCLLTGADATRGKHYTNAITLFRVTLIKDVVWRAQRPSR